MTEKRTMDQSTAGGKRVKLDGPVPYAAYQPKYQPENYDAKGVEEDGEKGRLIDGKQLAATIRQRLKQEVEQKVADSGLVSRPPGLVVVLVGDNPASKVYIRQKQKACAEVGIVSRLITMDADTTQETLEKQIDDLNADPLVDGILVQLPLPPHLQATQADVLHRILPDKDVDGFHPENLGSLVSRAPRLRPCTPWGVMQLIWSTGVNPYGLECLVVGASNHVGRPMILELLLNGAVVTCVHRFCRNLEEHVRRAECVIVAAGKPGLVKGEWIRPGAIVIDIGINRLDSGKLVGDVDFEAAKKNAGYITPVPGGVGPMTVAMLLENTVTAFDSHRTSKE